MAVPIFLVVFGIFFCVEAHKIGVGRLTRPQAGFFPFWMGFGLFAVSMILLIRQALQKPESHPSQSSWKGRCWWKVLLSLAILAFYAAVFESLGYCIATLLAMFFLLSVIAKKRWYVSFAISIATSLCTYAVFKLWLEVQLPKGFWGV